jgi:dehydrogenase/reductase SDR family protein 13
MTQESGKTFFVTGANTGIGKATAFELARRGGRVVLASRSEEKTRPVMAEIEAAVPGAKLDFYALDLANLSSVDRCAKSFLDSGAELDVLVNNAGLAGATGTTRDGFEVTTGTNHLGPFHLTELLLPRLREAPQGRVVNVASKAHFSAKKLDCSVFEKPISSATGTLPLYSQSKLMNVIHAKELARRLAGTAVTTYSLHPGVVASDVWREVPWPFRSLMKLFMITNEEGALTQLRCATDETLAKSTGRYFDKQREIPSNPVAEGEDVGRELFERSSELVRKALARA